MDDVVKQEKAKIAAVFKEKKGKKSYYRIAQLTGMSVTQVRQIDKSKSYTVDTLIKVCEALGCKLEITDKPK